MDLLALAVAKVEATLSQMVDYKITDNGIVLLVNFGIAGVKKFTFTVEELAPVEAQEVDQPRPRGKRR